MKILHVITGLPKSAGTTTFVENVVREQRALGHTVEICTNSTASILLATPTHPLTIAIFHLHGLWSPLLHRAARFAFRHHIPMVWSTHGMTAPWALHHKWWKKCLPWYLYQRRDLKSAALIHCTTDLEAAWNHQLGLTQTCVVPLGTSLPPIGKRTTHSSDSAGQPPASNLQPRVLLYVGRIYPVKALDRLIEAFSIALHSQSEPLSSSWTLRLVGPDQAGHLAELVSLCKRLGLSYSTPCDSANLQGTEKSAVPPSVQFAGPLFGDELDREYEACTALALVSHTENFGATVIDALAHGKPVITSTKTPWKVVADRNCGWWVDNEPATLASTVSQLFNLSTHQLLERGQRGRNLVEECYTWPAVAQALTKAYDNLADKLGDGR